MSATPGDAPEDATTFARPQAWAASNDERSLRRVTADVVRRAPDTSAVLADGRVLIAGEVANPLKSSCLDGVLAQTRPTTFAMSVTPKGPEALGSPSSLQGT